MEPRDLEIRGFRIPKSSILGVPVLQVKACDQQHSVHF